MVRLAYPPFHSHVLTPRPLALRCLSLPGRSFPFFSQNATNSTLQSYDLVSVSSSNEKLFHSCCSHESVDIVVIEGSRKLPFYLKKPAIKSDHTTRHKRQADARQGRR